MMRTWLTRRPGFNADGRSIGLGLAAAMDKQHEQATREVEDYLRHTPRENRRTTPTSA